MKKSLLQKILCAIFVVLGVVFIAIGVNMNAKNSELKSNCTAETQGIVADFAVSGENREHEEDGVDERLYHPIFEYEVDNQTYRQQSPIGKKQKRFDVGENVTVAYNPINPSEYYVPADTYGSGAGTINISLGIFMIVFVGFLVVIKRTKKKQPE